PMPTPTRILLLAGLIAFASSCQSNASVEETTQNAPTQPPLTLTSLADAELHSAVNLAALDTSRLRARATKACRSGNTLLLSNIHTLSPEEAEILADFTGHCLILDGLTSLDADTAAVLATWKGRGCWLSLNGLTHLDAGAAEHLATWPGYALSL